MVEAEEEVLVAEAQAQAWVKMAVMATQVVAAPAMAVVGHTVVVLVLVVQGGVRVVEGNWVAEGDASACQMAHWANAKEEGMKAMVVVK